MLGGLAVLVTLSACTEKPQTVGSRAAGDSAFKGTGSAPYTDPGWKAGDATSWEEHIRMRTQSGQNEYVRSTGK